MWCVRADGGLVKRMRHRLAVTYRRYFVAKLLYFLAAHASISCYFWTCDAEMS